MVDAIDINEKLKERDEPIYFEGDMTLKAFFALVDNKIDELLEYGFSTSTSKLAACYLLQIEQCDSEVFCMALDKWNVLAKPMRAWTAFKQHFLEADQQRRRTIKATGGKPSQHANNAMAVSQESLSTMFNDAVGTSAEAVEESIHAAIKSKFSQFKPTSRGHDNDDKLKSMKKTIATLERKLAPMKKAEGEKADGQSSSTMSMAKKKCKNCRFTHGPVYWKKQRDLAPGWWKTRNPK